MFLWFLKTYKDSKKAGQTGSWEDLIYETECFNIKDQ
jgi:hypothetical protein